MPYLKSAEIVKPLDLSAEMFINIALCFIRYLSPPTPGCA